MNTDAIQNLSLDIVHLIEPLVAVTIALTIGLALKDWVVNAIAGLVWRHVANEKIRSLKIERIIERPDENQPNGH